jgi:UV DNA damage endonuclease
MFENTRSTMDIRLGLCCINTEMRNRKKPIFSSRTVRLATIQKKGIASVKELALENLRDTIEILTECPRIGIHVFRLSSEIFPHATNPRCCGYDMDFANDLLVELGNTAKKLGVRLTAHPGQFNVLGSTNKATVNNTVSELNYQAEMFDRMGMGNDSVMVIHGGGLSGNKRAAKQRWVDNFALLSRSAQERLVLENCEKCYSVKDCIDISYMVCEKYGFHVPVVVDSHHYDCYNILHPDNQFTEIDKYMPCVLETWHSREIRPKVHISEQGSGKVGHHSDYVEVIPQYFLDISSVYGTGFDIMIEAKMKEKAIFHLMKNYPELFPL